MAKRKTETDAAAPAGTRVAAGAGGTGGAGATSRSGGSGGYPESVERLIAEFAKLPGIGRRSAERLVFHVLKSPGDEARLLSRAIDDVKKLVRHCRVCYNLTDWSRAAVTAAEGASDPGLCAVCAAASLPADAPDPTGGAGDRRDASVVMVVEQPKDLIALEQTGQYRGVYHVLMGRISPLEGVGPRDLTVDDLLARIDDPSRNAGPDGGTPIAEVVLALNPTMEGDGTALYLAQELTARGVRLTRLARGLPVGSTLEFASKAVLADAIHGRQPVR